MNLQQWQQDMAARMSTLEREFRTFRASRSDMSENAMKLVAGQLEEMKGLLLRNATAHASSPAEGENRNVTMRDVYIAAAFLAIGFAARLIYAHP